MPIPYRSVPRATLSTLVFAAACRGTPAAVAPSPARVAAGEIRIVAGSSGNTVTFDELAREASRADVVFFGEQHTDPATHHAELALLEAIGQGDRPVVLSLEMFERDVQQVVDDYVAGRITEAAFLAGSRPWPRYATDYRGLLELAKARGWPVVASNVPRQTASAVGRKGLGALDSLHARERAFAAREVDCPDDDYRRRFFEEMKGHSSGAAAPAPSDTLPTAVAQRFYLAQCVKDETMGEAIADALAHAGPGAIVVHYDGAFHSDFGAGTAERLRRRAPQARTLVVTAVPVADPGAAQVTDAKRADYVIFTKAPPKPPAP